MRKMNAQYMTVSLFSGAMGLDIELEQTGCFRVVACVEKEPVFCETIRTNQQSRRLLSNLKVFLYITDLRPSEILDALGNQET
ncbi:MAG: DNA cytosine methyltransferase [Deltaproteobacteria bacterium]|nr:DNA cytosine methyltransferase [Deltaproteobacteria bacterium]